MKAYLLKKWQEFSGDNISWGSCILNLIMCGCMAFFYIDSGKLIEPLIYCIFFLLYPVILFFIGKKIIPIMYLIFCAGATQDITFINCTCFLILCGLMVIFPKWKIAAFSIYVIEVFIVCMRHNKTPIHLLYHISLCLVLYFTVTKVVAEIRRRTIIEFTTESKKRLVLLPAEEEIIKQRAAGKLMKEIEGYSKNTKTAHIKNAMVRNNCKTPEEIIALYAIENNIDDEVCAIPEKMG